MLPIVQDIMLTHYPTLDCFSDTLSAQALLSNCSFIVITRNGDYCGLLTPKDIALHKKTLTGDCLCRKPRVFTADTLSDAIDKLNDSGYRALPCFNAENEFCGVISIERALESLCSVLVSVNIPKSILNNLQQRESSINSDMSLHDLSHRTKNPIQIILSSLHILLENNPEGDERKTILEASKATLQLDNILSRIFMRYFHEQ